jgi:SAM-dependent methyltransferase
MSRTSLDKPTIGLLCESTSAEEARIREAYAKRKVDDVRYSWFNPGNLYMIQEGERQLLALLRQYDFTQLASKMILELGCGAGYWIREFIKWGARPENITGIDLLPDRIAEARYLCPSGINLELRNAGHLDFNASTFDLVLQSTVFTSILDADLKRRVAVEMMRVVKPDGLIIWYDYHMDNPKNSDVKGVKYREIHALFPKCEIHLKRITLAPPIARLLAPYCWLLCCFLSKMPLLCTHYIGVIRKSSETSGAASREGKRLDS